MSENILDQNMVEFRTILPKEDMRLFKMLAKRLNWKVTRNKTKK